MSTRPILLFCEQLALLEGKLFCIETSEFMNYFKERLTALWMNRRFLPHACLCELLAVVQILENYNGKLQNFVLLCLFVILYIAVNLIDNIIYKDKQGKFH